MASHIGRSAFTASRRLMNSVSEKQATQNVLKQEARKNPELYVRNHSIHTLSDATLYISTMMK